jgi:hypothetical protein
MFHYLYFFQVYGVGFFFFHSVRFFVNGVHYGTKILGMEEEGLTFLRTLNCMLMLFIASLLVLFTNRLSFPSTYHH